MSARARGATIAVIVLALCAGACADGRPDQGPEVLGSTEGAEAAAVACPVLWDWTKSIGRAFNDAGRDVAEIDDAALRRQRWLDALDEMEQLNGRLAVSVAAWADDDPILGPLAVEIERDLPGSNTELDDIRRLIAETPEVDEEADDQIRAGTLITRVEKVIELPKPDFVVDDPDGVLLAAFQDEPSCQHVVRGADDGRVQANG